MKLLYVYLTILAVSEIRAENNTTKKSGKEYKCSKDKKRCEKYNLKNEGKWEAKYKARFGEMEEEDMMQLAGLLPINGNGTMVPFNKNQRNCNATKGAKLTGRRRKRATCTTSMTFDSRTQWSGCSAIIGKVQDQAQCGSCWAVATASTYNDRYCIQRAKQGVSTSSSSASSYFSASDVMSCAPNTYGCNGGSSYYAWAYIKSTGVVTGTDYTTQSGCKYYPFPPNSNTAQSTPSCTAKCSNSAWPTAYSSDKKYATWTKYLIGSSTTVTAIQNEIKANGSVVASMDVYYDFYYYNSGVYSAASTNYLGGHAVKLIGWGTQTCSDGTSQEFWLAVNSWNTGWGESGLFKIAKGVDECGIESGGIFYGTPKI